MKNDPIQKLDRSKLKKLIESIYNDHNTQELDLICYQLMQILDDFQLKSGFNENNNNILWDQTHAVLITYADSVKKNNESSLLTLEKIVSKYFGSLANVIHILPFLKSTSDGGFAVSSHTSLDDEFGDWEDLKRISEKHILMADIVLNHVSSSHPWVQQFIKCEEPGSLNVFAPSIDQDWSNVIRPRNSSLFSQINTSDGVKHVWTTFGPDQIDLNWHNPRILLDFLNLILIYVTNGVKWFRLDAVGFIWKEPSTTCLHLPKAHLIVQSLRIQLNNLLKNGVLITETNVPQKENLSYLQSADEAHMAYNFPLPPLLLEAVITSKADILNLWIDDWPDLPINTTLFNFSASHDGIGLRALEGLMDENRVKELLINCERRGGLISHRRLSNGEDKPYELNISWWSAMADSGIESTRFQFERFILTQLIVMSLKGVPAFYLPALLASENDLKTFYKTGQRRDLNREKFEYEKLSITLNNYDSYANKNLNFLKKAMDIRSNLECFNPNSAMKCLSNSRTDIVVFRRGIGNQSMWVIHNFTDNKLNYSVEDGDMNYLLRNVFNLKDYLTGNKYNIRNIQLDPFQVIWLGFDR